MFEVNKKIDFSSEKMRNLGDSAASKINRLL